MRNAVLSLLMLCNISVSLFAQNTQPPKTTEHAPLLLGITDQILSKELDEYRSLNIYFPQGYDPNSDTLYPVIYLLDGSANEDFLHISGLVQFLNMIDTIPPAIVVGIANVDRKRDFTFPTTVEKDKKDFPTTGGSAKFIAFIEKELQPYIQSKYRAGTQRTLIGQSLGGLLATEILLKKPTLFNSYLIVSPSLWWDNESLLSAAPALLQKMPDSNIRVFIAVGAEGKQMEEDAKKLSSLLTGSGKKGIHSTLEYMPAENHLTILHNAAYKGLETLFSRAPLAH